MSKTPISSETLADLKIPSDVKISPSGEHVVYAVRPFSREGEHAVSSIWIAETGKSNSARQLTSGYFNDRCPCWSPDGSSIAFLSDRGERGDGCAVYLLYMTGLAGSGEPVAITPATNKKEIELFDWSPCGSHIAFISADECESDEKSDPYVHDEVIDYCRLRTVDVLTRSITVLVERDIEVYQFGWSPDSKQIVFAFTDAPENRSETAFTPTAIEIVSVAVNSSTRLYETFNPVFSRLCWRKDGKYIYFISQASTDHAIIQSKSVWAIEVETRSVARLAFGETNCATKLDMNARGEIYMGAQNNLIDIIYTVNYTLRYESVRDILDASVHQVSDTSYRIVTIEGTAREPVKVVSRLFQTDTEITGKQQPDSITLSCLNSGVFTEARWKEMRYASKDGSIRDLDGWFFALESIMPGGAANSQTPKPLPTVVWVHGGPYRRCSNTWDVSYHQWMPKLISTGKYGVLVPNYRGGSGRGQKFARATSHAVGTIDYDDVLACIEASIAMGLTDKNRIVIAGWSQGGFLSYTAAVRNGELPDWKFKGAVCGAGVTDWDIMVMTSDATNFQAEASGHYPWEASEALDKKSQQFAKRASPIRQVGDYKDDIPPLLMLHGQCDERVPPSQATGFRKALRSHSVKAKYHLVTYPRESHLIRERAHIIDMMDRVLSFVNLHIGS